MPTSVLSCLLPPPNVELTSLADVIASSRSNVAPPLAARNPVMSKLKANVPSSWKSTTGYVTGSGRKHTAAETAAMDRLRQDAICKKRPAGEAAASGNGEEPAKEPMKAAMENKTNTTGTRAPLVAVKHGAAAAERADVAADYGATEAGEAMEAIRLGPGVQSETEANPESCRGGRPNKRQKVDKDAEEDAEEDEDMQDEEEEP